MHEGIILSSEAGYLHACTCRGLVEGKEMLSPQCQVTPSNPCEKGCAGLECFWGIVASHHIVAFVQLDEKLSSWKRDGPGYRRPCPERSHCRCNAWRPLRRRADQNYAPD